MAIALSTAGDFLQQVIISSHHFYVVATPKKKNPNHFTFGKFFFLICHINIDNKNDVETKKKDEP
jgi:hypothetical protein